VKGQQVGIGFALSTPVIYYNADLMRKAGVEPDRFPMNWDAIMNAAKKSKAATPGTESLHVEWDITGNWMCQALVFSNGAHHVDRRREEGGLRRPRRQGRHADPRAARQAG
ncbi:extracellular solute-binding protein, partial [Acidovorax sp. BL-A-41-H1]|uniref:extracellular solute-binding protein n=1 Tax=Acidovorax sp. BL-A-41-H1 TaxID=3421102 RepID=UPI003F78CBE4